MPSFSKKVSVPGRSSQELFEKVSSQLSRFLEKTPIGKHDLVSDADQKTVSIKSAMFSGKIACKDGSIEVDAQLSLMAMPFRSKLDEGIEKWVQKILS